ncbi:hypothetical protein BSR03_01515 [Serratia proteamaculans]|nr:hypothetical protein BSR03_01515 [Serratia proteamaculans]
MASKRRLRRKQCEGKRRHKNFDCAMKEIRLLHQRHGHQGQLQPYRCPFCSMFHVGHTPGRNGIGSGYRGNW